jgi:cytochrome c556
MKAMRSVILGVTLAIGVSASVPATALDGAQSVYARKAIMWSIGAHMRGIKAGLKAKDGATVGAAANAIAAMSAALPGLFVLGTHQGSKYKTRAKSDIWANIGKFAAANKVLQREARALAKVAKSNDPAAMGKQFGRMAKLGCGGCHRPFRGPKNK